MFEKIEKLLDAGFTKDEIMKLIPQDAPAPEPEKKPEPKPEEKPEEKPEPKPEPKPEEKPAAEPFDTQPFNAAIDEMTKAMNAMNVKLQKMALSMYEAPAETKKVESIIAKIVDPRG